MKKRILSVVLLLAMLSSLMAPMVLAEETEPEVRTEEDYRTVDERFNEAEKEILEAGAMAEAGHEARVAGEAARTAQETHSVKEAKAAYQTLLYAQKRDWNALKKINRDIVGWITIPGTDIDCPIMQGNDNEFYKTHSYEGKEDENGSIFLDTHCRADFGSTNTVLHGDSFKLDSAVSAPADDNSFMDEPAKGQLLTLTTLADDTGAQRIVVTGNAVG